MHNQLRPSQDRLWNLLAKKVAKEASSDELLELNTILLNNSDLHHQADLLAEMWTQSAKPETRESEAAYVKHMIKHKEDFFTIDMHDGGLDENSGNEEKKGFIKSIIAKRKLFVFSVSILIVIFSGTFYYYTTQKSMTALADTEGVSSVVTKNGSRTKIVLPDGSQVWLNAGSNLDYNNSVFNKSIREVSLNGEAYFDVAKNPEKPFIIHTRKMDIKVIGTAFNVRSYSNEKTAEASLIRGSIEVTLKDRKNQKILLKPNEKISVSNDEQEQVVNSNKQSDSKRIPATIPQIVVKEIKPSLRYNIIGEIAWTENKLYFEDENMENIGLLIERWFGKKVVIMDENMGKVRYTGNFENESLEEVLGYLKLSNPFNYKVENNTVFIY